MTPSPVDWGGLHNARDLGGIGGIIAAGALFRSPRLDALDAAAWLQIDASGVLTIVDLRNNDEVVPLAARPAHLRVIRAPIENQSDEVFMAEWGTLLGTPDYYAESLRRWPALIATAIGAVSDAPPGGVLVHCAAGRDRTGLIVALILAVAGVPVVDIVDDYEVGVRATNEFLRANPESEPHLDELRLSASLTAKRASLAAFLAGLDAESYLVNAGVTNAQLSRLRARLLA